MVKVFCSQNVYACSQIRFSSKHDNKRVRGIAKIMSEIFGGTENLTKVLTYDDGGVLKLAQIWYADRGDADPLELEYLSDRFELQIGKPVYQSRGRLSDKMSEVLRDNYKVEYGQWKLLS